MNLFQQATVDATTIPLATRMRPRTLDEFVGQDGLVGAGKPLRVAIERDALSSCILYGPPGSGKSTLANIMARRTRAAFESYSAVASGVAEMRRVIQHARERREFHGRRTVLFVDEIHRFNKAQQDAFLPHVEDGTIILIGATTQNPFFEVIGPLLSRARIDTLEPLTLENIGVILDRAVTDTERGLRGTVTLEPGARVRLIEFSAGDARVALNALEMAAFLATQDSQPGVISAAIAAAVLTRPLVRYDRAGDQHYDTISAFIKSIRGSEPDAAVFWLAHMLEAGEDPRFIARRLVIHAAEDVGNADPQALVVATAAAHAVEYVGLPEARIPLAQATLYLATAPKSNAAYQAISRAQRAVREQAPGRVPAHLRDTAYPGARQLGHGEGYQYPHDAPGHFVPQDYGPEGRALPRFYVPSDQGYEVTIARRLAAWWRKRGTPASERTPATPQEAPDA